MAAARKVLITGATGQVARPVAEMLAKEDEVWCLGRFGDLALERELAAQGMRTWRWDMGQDDLDGLPGDFTHVMHAAVLRDSDDFDAAVEVNSVAAGQLMSHCRRAEAFLFVSASAVYARQAREHRHAETDPLGGLATWMPSYPVGKLAAEGAVRAFARTLRLPTVIARLNVACGPRGHGGLPVRYFRLMLAGEPIEVPRDGENWCMPIHTDDIARQVPLLWQAASVPARIVNWGGDAVVSVRELMAYVSEITGVPARFTASEVTRDTFAYDNTRRQALIGGCVVGWQQAVWQTIEAHFPGAVIRGGDQRADLLSARLER
jgi:nucleoside-diphosphate-sugar epimerase